MTIKTIKVKNFKSFKDLQVDLGKFNVLIGANASGKSNFIQIFKFLRDITAHGLDNAVQLQGGPEYLTNLNTGIGEILSIQVVLSQSHEFPRETFLLYDRKARGGPGGGIAPLEAEYTFAIRFHRGRQGFEVIEDRLAFKSEFVAFGREGGTSGVGERYGIGDVVVSHEAGEVTLKPFPPADFPLDEYAIKPFWVAQMLPAQSLIMENPPFWLTGFYFGDVAIYDFDPRLPKEGTLITGKAELEEDGNNLAIVLNRIIQDKDQERKLANLLQDLLPFIARLDVQRFADKSLLFNAIETYTKNANLPASFISDGTINIIALIVALYFEEKPVAIIEEPDRNIHPYLISKVIGMMKDASKKKQVIVTTHNPEVVKSAEIGDVLLVSRNAEGFSTVSRPSEREDVKAFLQNEMGLEELFVQNLLHA
jgi:predicted ATPase